MHNVLILIVVEDGLVRGLTKSCHSKRVGLNPYCSGRWSRTIFFVMMFIMELLSLNPYCSGRWSRTATGLKFKFTDDTCLNPYCSGRWSRTQQFQLVEMAM